MNCLFNAFQRRDPVQLFFVPLFPGSQNNMHRTVLEIGDFDLGKRKVVRWDWRVCSARWHYNLIARRLWVLFQAPCMFSLCLCGFSGNFLPRSKNLHLRWIGKSVGVRVSVNGCFPLRGAAMNWQLVQGVAVPSPYDNWEWLQQSLATRQMEDGWMVGCLQCQLVPKCSTIHSKSDSFLSVPWVRAADCGRLCKWGWCGHYFSAVSLYWMVLLDYFLVSVSAGVA